MDGDGASRDAATREEAEAQALAEDSGLRRAEAGIVGSLGPRAGGVVPLALANASLLVQGLLVGTLQARALGPAGRGDLAKVLVPANVMVPLASVGLFSAATVLLNDRRFQRREVLGSLAAVAIALGICVAVLGAPIAALLAPGRPHLQHLLRIVFLFAPIALVQEVVSGVVVGLARWSLASIAKAAGPLLLIIGGTLLYATDSLTVTSMTWLNVAALAPTLALLTSGALTVGRPRISAATARAGLRFGSQAWLSSLASLANARLDQLLMLRLVSARELGLYVVAVNVSAVLFPLSAALGMTTLTTTAQGGTTADIERVCRINAVLIGTLAVPLAVVSWFVVPVAFGRGFADARLLCIILLVAALPLAMLQVLLAAATGWHQPRLAALAEGVALVVTVVGLLVFLKPYGARAAAVVSLVAYASSLATLLFTLHRKCGLRARRCFAVGADDVAAVVRVVRRAAARLPLRAARA